jgi:hypothetical protein
MTHHQADSTIQDFKAFFQSENLQVPTIAAHLENCLTYYPGGHWATQPTPALVERYSVTDLLEYLKGSVRDQYSFSYERYGGVYELNFRHVSGELAMIVHFFSGGFRDSEIGTAEWNGMVMCINSLLTMTTSVSGEERMRKYLLVVSKFPHEFQFLERNGNNWEIVEQIDTWEAAYDYLKSVGQDK